MKTKFRIAFLLFSICMILSLTSVMSVFAAETNISMTLSTSEVEVGDTFTVVISNADLNAAGFGVVLNYADNKDLIECTDVTGVDGDEYLGMYYSGRKGAETWIDANVGNDAENTNSDGIFSFGVVTGKDTDFFEGTVATLTFTAKATGTVTFTLTERTSGVDSYDGVAATATLTIKEAAPACNHADTKVVSNGNGTHDVVCADETCGATVQENVPCSGGTATCVTLAKCSECGGEHGVKNPNNHYYGNIPQYYEDNGDGTHTGYCGLCRQPMEGTTGTHDKATTATVGNCKMEAYYTCGVCKLTYKGEKDPDVHAAPTALYKDKTDKTHTVYYGCCPDTSAVVDNHDFKNDAHTCVCGVVEQFTIYFYDTGDASYPSITAPYGSDIAPLANPSKTGYVFIGWSEPIPETMPDYDVHITARWEEEHVCAHDRYDITATTHQSICSCGEPIGAAEPHGFDDFVYTCKCGAKYTGWKDIVDGEDHTSINTRYILNGVVLYGWNEVEGDWYYFNTTTGFRAEGVTRVPYNTELGHGPNASDKAYWEAHQDTSKYTDAETAVYVFGEDGKLNRTTGIVDGNRYAVDGVIAWHVGLVEVDGEYYYFGGDENGNGNVMMTGKVYASRNNTELRIVSGGVYLFNEDGTMVTGDGITEVDGVLYYLDNNRVAIEAGLVEIDGAYYYVRSSGDKAGQLVVGRDYWVLNTNKLLAAGMYTFGADGKIVMGAESEEYDGIVNIDGTLYYYKGGVKQVGAGVVELTDDAGDTFYIYVKSNGELATGTYWPTTRNDLLDRGAYDWGTDGRYYPAD